MYLEHLVPSWWNLLKVLMADIGHWGQAGYNSLALLPAQPIALSLSLQCNRATAPSCSKHHHLKLLPLQGTVSPEAMSQNKLSSLSLHVSSVLSEV